MDNFLKFRDKSVLCILCPVPRVLCPPGHGDPGFLGGGRGSGVGMGAKGGTLAHAGAKLFTLDTVYFSSTGLSLPALPPQDKNTLPE